MMTIPFEDLPAVWLLCRADELRDIARATGDELRDLERATGAKKSTGVYGRGCRHAAKAYGEAAGILEKAAEQWRAEKGGTDAPVSTADVRAGPAGPVGPGGREPG